MEAYSSASNQRGRWNVRCEPSGHTRRESHREEDQVPYSGAVDGSDHPIRTARTERERLVQQ
jgi:hypothetical protein